MTSAFKSPDAKPQEVLPSAAALAVADNLAFDEIQDLAERCASYWLSVREAAFRGERLTVAVHLRQARLITRHVAEIAATLAEPERAA